MMITSEHGARGVDCGFRRRFKFTCRRGGWAGLLLLAVFTGPGGPRAEAAPTATTAVTVAWTAPNDPTVVGYYVYYGGVNGVFTNKTSAGHATSLVLSNLVVGKTYYLAATSCNAAGIESAFSGEAVCTVAAPSGHASASVQSSVSVPGAAMAVSDVKAAAVAAPSSAKRLVLTAQPSVSDAGAAPVVPGVTAAAQAAPPPGLQLVVTPDQQFVLTVTGPANHIYDIQATPDLAAWTVIGTVTNSGSGSLNFTDTNAAGFSSRYYRLQDTSLQ